MVFLLHKSESVMIASINVVYISTAGNEMKWVETEVENGDVVLDEDGEAEDGAETQKEDLTGLESGTTNGTVAATKREVLCKVGLKQEVT